MEEKRWQVPVLARRHCQQRWYSQRGWYSSVGVHDSNVSPEAKRCAFGTRGVQIDSTPHIVVHRPVRSPHPLRERSDSNR